MILIRFLKGFYNNKYNKRGLLNWGRPNIQNIQDPRAHAREVPLYEQSMPTSAQQGHMSPEQHSAASAGNPDANGIDLHRILHAPEGVLPSDVVSYPTMRTTAVLAILAGNLVNYNGFSYITIYGFKLKWGCRAR